MGWVTGPIDRTAITDIEGAAGVDVAVNRIVVADIDIAASIDVAIENIVVTDREITIDDYIAGESRVVAGRKIAVRGNVGSNAGTSVDIDITGNIDIKGEAAIAEGHILSHRETAIDIQGDICGKAYHVAVRNYYIAATAIGRPTPGTTGKWTIADICRQIVTCRQ